MSTLYDTVPYHDEPFISTHPNTLATIGRLFGIQTEPPEKCRLLELGAAKGSNIIAMAYCYPESHFTGIDLSKEQVKIGNEIISKLGLSNITLIEGNIIDIANDLPEFDYIVSHGVLSWVPENVRDKIFEICGAKLSSNGLCYLSYNTYPGWKSRDILKDIMIFDTQGIENLPEKVRRAKQSLAILGATINDSDNPALLQLKQEIPAFKSRPDWYFLHDFLADNNRPFYIAEIFKYADSYGLQYLSDTELPMNTIQGMTKEAQNIIRQLRGDLLKYEQYSDIARFRAFRRSVFCKKSIQVDRSRNFGKILSLYVASRLKPGHQSPENLERIRFQHVSGGMMEVKHPVAIEAFNTIQKSWPRGIAIQTLSECARNLDFPEAKSEGESDNQNNPDNILFESLLQGIFAGILELRTSPGAVTRDIPKKPRASDLARMQAENGNIVTTLLHTQVALDQNQIQLLRQLDGSKDKNEILEALKGSIINSEEFLEKYLSQFIDEGLIHL
ncbi:MAG TPA: class I SAM-dependent methyltransferase [Oligoflexia bacterium]|nr:class I SAM-dependent methyltransferase [Oligoflexia bacterium]HMP49476.1 class I SAM-dependent methyltransferase [Oligoflexia bacterium]